VAGTHQIGPRWSTGKNVAGGGAGRATVVPRDSSASGHANRVAASRRGGAVGLEKSPIGPTKRRLIPEIWKSRMRIGKIPIKNGISHGSGTQPGDQATARGLDAIGPAGYLRDMRILAISPDLITQLAVVAAQNRSSRCSIAHGENLQSPRQQLIPGAYCS